MKKYLSAAFLFFVSALSIVSADTSDLSGPRGREFFFEAGMGIAEPSYDTGTDLIYRIVFRQKLYEEVETLQKDLDKWLHEYNYERPHLGYRNQGRRPWETIELYLQNHDTL